MNQSTTLCTVKVQNLQKSDLFIEDYLPLQESCVDPRRRSVFSGTLILLIKGLTGFNIVHGCLNKMVTKRNRRQLWEISEPHKRQSIVILFFIGNHAAVRALLSFVLWLVGIQLYKPITIPSSCACSQQWLSLPPKWGVYIWVFDFGSSLWNPLHALQLHCDNAVLNLWFIKCCSLHNGAAVELRSFLSCCHLDS